MAESSNYSRSVHGDSDEDYGRSVLSESDEDYGRSVQGGSDEDYGRSVLGGSDEEYGRSVQGGSDEDYGRSVLGGSDEDYGRSKLSGSDEDNCRSVLGGSDEDYGRSVLGGSDEDYGRSMLGGSDVNYRKPIFCGTDEVKENPSEPCQNDGKNTPAFKYCTHYSEYMNGPSSKNHTNKALKHHVIMDAEVVKPVINKDSTKTIDKTTDQLARLDIKVQTRSGNVISSPRNVTAKLVSTIDVSSSNDNQSPHILDLAVVQTHYCVVTDWKNKSVKVVDTRTRRVTSQIQIRYADIVASITSVNDDQVAVAETTNGVSKILLFSVSTSGIIIISDTHKSLTVKYTITGIAHGNDRFYAIALNQIFVISMQGQIITTFSNESFCGLRGIAVSNDHNTLYVCSWGNGTVFSVDLNGNVTGSYKDKDLERPRGITVDNDGYVYVCCYDTRCVYQLNADLRKGKVIIQDDYVWKCVFNKNDKRLFLNHRNQIKVYDLRRVNELKKQRDELRDDLTYMKSHSMRNNLIFTNIAEDNSNGNETSEITEGKLRQHLQDALKIKKETAESIRFERVHRTPDKPITGKVRNIVAKFTFFQERQLVRREWKHLKGTQFHMFEQYPKEFTDRRRGLVKKMKDYRKKGKKSWIVYDTLYVDGCPIRD